MIYLLNLLSYLLTMSATQPAVTYHVKMANASTHYLNIEMHVTNIIDDVLNVKMPVWTPGSYLIREYPKNVDYVRAMDSYGNSIPVKKIEKNIWQVECGRKDFILEYAIYGFEESVRTNFIDDRHASIIPAATFLYLEKYDVPLTIHFYPFKGWEEISTALERVDNNNWIRTAPNKDVLYDSPVEIGNHKIFSFTAANVEHEIAMVGEGNYNSEKLIADMQKIIEEEANLFGDHPSPNYLFIIHNIANGGGGLEHLNSTSLLQRRWNYEPDNNYSNFLGLVSHEYFHLWNGKRLRPLPLGPFNYDAENYTTSLWIVEGFTSYYDDLILRRADIMTPLNYLNVVETNINNVFNAPGDTVQPVADASFDAWIKYYRSNENTNNSQVNYYSKGALLALALDLMIINNSGRKYSLDDVMRYTYTEYYQKQNRGYTEEEFKAVLEKFAGVDLTPFYAHHVFSTQQIDLKKYFDYVGIDVTNLNTDLPETDFGLTISDKNIITAIRRNSSGEKGGLNVNDEIIAVNQFRYNQSLFASLLLNKKAGDAFELTVSRNGLTRNFTISLQNTDKVSYNLILNKDATDLQKENYKKWMDATSFD